MPADLATEKPRAIRILVASLPLALAQWLLPRIEQEPDMVVVGQVEANVELLLAAGMGVDVVILASAQVWPPPGICSHLLTEYPDLKLLVVKVAADEATLYWSGLRRRPLRTVTDKSLLTTIRQAPHLRRDA